MATKKNRRGRPTKLTPEVIAKLEWVFSIGGTIAEACRHAGISRTVYYEGIKRYPEFAEKFARLQEQMILEARNTLSKGVKESPRLAQSFLSNTRPHEFGKDPNNYSPADFYWASAQERKEAIEREGWVERLPSIN